MSVIISGVTLKYCHLQDLYVDKVYDREVYRCLALIPNTLENRATLRKLVDDAIEYGKTTRLKGAKLQAKPARDPYDFDSKLDADGKFIQLNLDSKNPITVYDKYGDKLTDFDKRTVYSADIALFGFAWARAPKWGVKLCIDGVKCNDDLSGSDQASIGGFVFEKRSGSSSDGGETSDESTRVADDDNPFAF